MSSRDDRAWNTHSLRKRVTTICVRRALNQLQAKYVPVERYRGIQVRHRHAGMEHTPHTNHLTVTASLVDAQLRRSPRRFVPRVHLAPRCCHEHLMSILAYLPVACASKAATASSNGNTLWMSAFMFTLGMRARDCGKV